jgi:hypothetical protein
MQARGGTQDGMVSSSDNRVSGVRMMSETIEWILIKDAAAIADMHVESIRRLCRKGSIRCRQLIKDVSVLEVDKNSLIQYLNTDKKYGGRPRKTEL